MLHAGEKLKPILPKSGIWLVWTMQACTPQASIQVPSSLLTLASQSLHASNHLTPEPVEYVPAWQGLQVPEADAPATKAFQHKEGA